MTAPAAGWYQDPADAGAWRWWDGSAWTDHTQPIQQVVQATPVVAVVPEPVNVVPQPGDVVAAPHVTPVAQAASLTPTTPVTDQMYWHSAAAERIEVPRMTHTGSIQVQNGPRPTFVRDWNDLGSPSTAGVWLLAFSPVLFVLVGVVIEFANIIGGGIFGPFASLVAFGVATGLGWIFAFSDMRSLRDRGYHPPSVWWMLLLPPLAYLIARGRAVRREGRRAWPAELVFILCFLGVIAVRVLLTMSILAQLGVPGL